MIRRPTGTAAGVRCAESSAGLVPTPDAAAGICCRWPSKGLNKLHYRNTTAPEAAAQTRQVVTHGQETLWAKAGACARLRRLGYRFRSTRAGFWPRAVNVPIRPSATITTTAPLAAAISEPGNQTNERFIALTIIRAAAAEPAATPKTAVPTPRTRYSSA